MVGRADLSSSDKGKTGAEFQQEPFEMIHQPRFQLPLAERFVQGQEVKDIGVFQGVLGEFRMRFRQLRVKIVKNGKDCVQDYWNLMNFDAIRR